MFVCFNAYFLSGGVGVKFDAVVIRTAITAHTHLNTVRTK